MAWAPPWSGAVGRLESGGVASMPVPDEAFGNKRIEEV